MTRVNWLCLLLISVLALGAGLSGTGHLPLDDHEVYVAQTAQNMLDSHDWIVPRLNDSLRLQKPPLSYWASAAVATAQGHDHISELDARWPSVMAGLFLALLVFVVARVLARDITSDRTATATGLLASMIAIGSLGFFRYVHSARADMLYGLLAFAMFAAYVWTTRLQGRRQLGAALLIWLALGLHVLAKGPQFGFVVLLAIFLHAGFSAPDWRTVWRRLRPELGLVLLAVVVVPWWLAVQHAVGPQLGDSQLSGSLLGVSPGRLLSGFYWWHAPGQWAPWLVLIVPAVGLAWRQRRQTAGLLLLVLLLAIVVFSLGSQYRDIYMAPTVGFAAVWLALGAGALCASSSRWAWAGWALQALLLVVIVAGGLIWVALHLPMLSLVRVLAMSVATGLVLCVLERLRHLKAQPNAMRLQILILLGSALIVALMAAATVPSIWSGTRFYQYQLTQDMQPYRKRPLAVLAPLPPEVFVYYLRRPVVVADDALALCRWAAAQPADSHPLMLFHPAQSALVERAVPDSTPLLQSPGSRHSSVIVAEVAGTPRCIKADERQ